MGMFGKMQKKLHIKSHKHSHGKQVPGEYDSKPVTEEEANHLNHTDDGTENHSHEDSQLSHRRGPVQLQMANAPEKTWGRKGLDSGQTYTFQRDGGDKKGTQPPATQKPAAAAPQADGRQQAPAAQAADKVADMGGGPGAGAASPESDLPTSGQASLGEAEHAPVKPTKPRTAANKVVQAMVIVQAIAAGYVALLAIFILLFRVNVLWIVLYAILGFPIGLGYSWLLNTARRTRQQTAAQLRITPGQKGLAAITGEVPSWIHFSDREKVRWMNAILTEMWPFYDKAVCAMVKESVEPIMEQYKPPGLIKKMYFKHLTFGDAPFKIENVWVEEHSKDHVLMEVALRWAGDANIAIAVELPAGGEATRMVPKVSDVRINAVARITLAPLVGDMPGFGAAVISLRKPPQIKFKLNFGKALGSSATAKPVQAWLDPFLRNTLGDMLVWPNRIVVPILGEDITGPLDHLMLRHKGVLQVWVMQAKDLHKQDVTGKADPFVELSTRVQQVEKTDKKKNTLAPVWQERKFLMVQEPTTQLLRLEMFDWDRINAKELLTLNLVKGIAETIGASTLMGRAAIPIKKYADNDGTEFDEWIEMGKGSFSNDNGCGKGKGKVRLRIRYMSLGAIYSEPRRATVGAILLTLKKCEDLASADLNGYSDPYVVMKLGNGKQARQKSTIKHFTLNAEYNEKFEWFKVPYDEILDVKVYDSDTLGGDDLLGRVEIDVGREIATSPNGEVLRTWYLAEVPVDKKLGEPRPSSITMHVQWVPWDIDEAGAPPPVQEF